MEVQKATREFRYNSVVLPDPDPNLSVEQVRDTFSALYPEIVNADIEGPEASGAKMIYTFRRAVGTKGSSNMVASDTAEQDEAETRRPGVTAIFDALQHAHPEWPVGRLAREAKEEWTRRHKGSQR